MKKKVLALTIICCLLFSILSVSVSADVPERVILDNSVFYIDVPENYMYYTENSENFCIMDSDFGSQELEFFVEGNLMFPDGFQKASDEEIVSKVRRIVKWGVDFTVNGVERKTVNGQKTAIVSCTEDSFGVYDYEYYLFATKEAICVISVYYDTEEEKQEIQGMLETFVLNGTNFPGDKPINDHDFSSSPDYYEAIEEIAEEYYDYNEEFDDIMWGVFGFFGLCLLGLPALFIALILLIIGWRKNKKLVKEYEGYFGNINAVRYTVRAQQAQYNQYNMGYNYQANPYGANGQPQQNYQPQANQYPQQMNYQPAPVPQPVSEQPQQTSVLNGEAQNNNQQ